MNMNPSTSILESPPKVYASSSSTGAESSEEVGFAENPNESTSPETYAYHHKLPTKKMRGSRQYHLGGDMNQQPTTLFDEETDVQPVEEQATNSLSPQRNNVRTRRKHGKKRYSLGDDEATQENVVVDIEMDQIDSNPDDDNTEISQGSSASLCKRVMNESLALLCPFAVLCRALLTCDMNLFWKLCSSLFVIKAFWSSTLVLGFCTLFKVHRIIPDMETDGTTNTTEAFLFGLWTYTDKLLDQDHSLGELVEREFERLETCRFHMQKVDEVDAPDGLFLNDAAFTIARAFAVMVVGMGFISMLTVWFTAANASCCRTVGRKRWILPAALATCSIFECFVFLILASSVCKDSEFQEQRHCTLQADSGMIFASIISWLITAVASMKVHVPIHSIVDDSVHSRTDLPGDKSLDMTFDDSDEDHNPSRLEIS